jgi:hypothetical protein
MADYSSSRTLYIQRRLLKIAQRRKETVPEDVTSRLCGGGSVIIHVESLWTLVLVSTWHS